MGIRLIAGLLLLTLLNGCNVNKYLRNDEYLIEKNEVLRNGTKIDKGNIEAFVRQKPNRRFLGTVRFNLWLYNQVDQDKMRRIKQKRDARYDSINARRIIANDIKNKKRVARGRKPKEPKLKDKDKLTFRENILEVGEPPVLLDTFLTNLTTKKMQRYVYSKGYFDSKVSDSIVVDQKNKRASVFYSITKSEPYRIRNIKYKIEDPLMEYFIFNDTINTLIKRGRRFDEELFQRERERIVDVQLDNGYYYFAPQYIYYLADTGLTGNIVDLTIGLKKFSEPYSATNDSLVYKNHPRLTINRVYIVLENLQGTVKNTDFRDTSIYKGIYFLSNEPLRFRHRDIAKQISIAEGQLYQQSLAEDTYKALTGLRVFKAVSVQYVPNRQHPDKLDCYIYCPPIIKQATTTEVEGTNTSGNLGIAGSLVFQNKNAFRGAELVELKLKGAITAQQQFNNKEQGNINGLQSTFNTYQLGPELNIYFPRPLFPFNLFYYKKDEKSKRIFAQPKTYLNMSFNYQSRFEYSRTITNVSYGFRFNNYKGLFQYDVIPLEIYSVKAKLYGSFEQDLININDFFLLNSFRDHLTPLSKVSATYNNQSISTKKRYYTYARLSLSSSGNIMRGLYSATNQPKDTAGRYNIAGVPFSQFVKVEADWRFYVKVRRKNMLVFRMAGGIGKPLANLNVLPYEQSFFSGGPNSVRAWRARTLGPGSYDPSNNSARYDKLGDLQLEGNFEYRFHIFKSFYGAWFADAGNVWLLKPQVTKPNGDFELNRFYKEFGVGSGFGLRYDFSFFVLRLDAAMRIYDPKYAENDRWTFNKKPVSTTILNFGIGYPF